MTISVKAGRYFFVLSSSKDYVWYTFSVFDSIKYVFKLFCRIKNIVYIFYYDNDYDSGRDIVPS